MPFGDLYERSEKETTRHWKSVISTFALLAVVLISVFGLYSICEDYITEYLKESSRIIHIDAVCKNLPKPDSFVLVKRENPVSYNNNNATEIVYRYQGDSQVIIPQFIEWFRANDWKRRSDNELIFTKGEQTIAIKSADNYLSQYDIHCYREDSSFGIYD